MAVTNIEQEIIDWYNENDTGESVEYVGSALDEFIESLSKKEDIGKVLPYSGREVSTAVLASGPAYLVNDVHGEDGDYEARYLIFQVGDQLFRINGYYSSWDGDNWEDSDIREVEAYTETVTRYRNK